MPIGTSRSGGSGGRSYFRHQVIDIGPTDILQRDFPLDFEAAPSSELVCYNLSVLVPSEDARPRDYRIIDGKILRLESYFTLLPNDIIHIYYQLL